MGWRPLIWAWYLALAGLLLLPGGLGYLKPALTYLIGLTNLPEMTNRAGLRPSDFALGDLGIAVILAVSATSLGAQVFSGPDGKLHVYFFDVDQGDSQLIVTPNGRQVLIDGGPGVESAAHALSGPLSPWDRSLELVLLLIWTPTTAGAC